MKRLPGDGGPFVSKSFAAKTKNNFFIWNLIFSQFALLSKISKNFFFSFQAG
jgi:hypothetical protein